MTSNHLTLFCPLLLLPSIFPRISVFSSKSPLHIRWPKYWSFSKSFQWIIETALAVSWFICCNKVQQNHSIASKPTQHPDAQEIVWLLQTCWSLLGLSSGSTHQILISLLQNAPWLLCSFLLFWFWILFLLFQHFFVSGWWKETLRRIIFFFLM